MRLLKGLLIGACCALPLAVCAGSSDDGVHADWADKSVDPGKDFFAYANGDWQKANPIPAAYSRWGTLSIMTKQNQEVVHGILEDLAKQKNLKGGTIEQKVGDFYASGMDEQAVDAAGIKPLDAEFQRIDAIKDTAGLQAELAHLQLIGVDAGINFAEVQDFKDSSKVIGAAIQGGLGLPNRDYYLKTADKCVAPAAATAAAQAAQADYASCKTQADKFQKQRDAYVTHVTNMFKLLGDADDKAAVEAKTVMVLETNLAQASMSRVDERTPENIYHPMDRKVLSDQMPGFDWPGFFAGIGHPEIQSINLAMPDYFKAYADDLSKVSLDDWKIYLRWHLVHDLAPYLSKPFVDENFQLTKTLSGAQELLPRWQRVVATENGAMGFAIGKVFVEKKFPPSSKQAVLDIIHSIRAALKNDLQTLAWMSPATREAAIKKLDLMGERIGYPDKWRDYSALKVVRGPYVTNVIAANEFLQKREFNKIGKPVDKNEWDMTPQTVNAYYDPSMNNINFPAGILQPPIFDPKAPMAVNYGSIGFVVGHEMTHGFDDQGARFDPKGNLLPEPGWWTAEDFTKFRAATTCIADHYSQYTVATGAHVQGKLVTGEATADLGGLTLGWRAFHASKAYKNAKTVDGYTPDQQFFLGAAHVWAENIRDEAVVQQVTTNEHAPAVYRVNGTVANMPQFQQAFGVADGSPMVNKDRCVIW